MSPEPTADLAMAEAAQAASGDGPQATNDAGAGEYVATRAEARRRGPAARRRRERLFGLLWPVGAAVLITVLWELAVGLFDVKSYVLPPPTEVFATFVERGDRLWFHSVRTLQQSVLGFAIGGLTAYALGVAMSYSRIMERTALPYVIAANTIPIVAIAPLVILWLGPGMSSKVFVTAFLVLFPVTVNTLRGMRDVASIHAELMSILGANRRQEFVKLRFFSSLPFVFTGLKIGATMAVIGSIVAEFVGSTRGLGYIMVQSSFLLDTRMLWASMIASSLLGLSMFLAVVLVERLTVPWAASSLR